MNNYCLRIKSNIDNLLLTSWVKPFSNNSYIKEFTSPTDWSQIIDSSFIEELNTILPIDRLLIFNKPKFVANRDAHIDRDTLFALNIVQTSAKSPGHMQWFNQVVPTNNSVTYSANKVPYFNFKEDALKLVHSEDISNSVTIVRTDIPHRIAASDEHRTCYSFRFKNNFQCWEDVYCTFSRYYSCI